MATYEKPVAFIVTDEMEGRADVFFERSHAAARRAGAGEFGVEFGDVTCRREPRYDNGVTMQQRLEDGWHWDCAGPNCQRVVDNDTEGRVVGGETVYCSEACRESHARQKADRKRREDAVRAEALRIRPDATINRLYLNVGDEPVVDLTLPSGRGVTCSLEWLASEEGQSA